MKNIKKIFITLMVLFSSIGLSSCTTKQESDPATFNDFANSIFYTVLAGDEMSMNYLFENRELFGLEQAEPSLPSPGGSNIIGLIALNAYIGKVNTYDYNKLSFDQKMAYNVIKDLLDSINKTTPDMDYMDNSYLGSYLGYQAQLPILLMRYNLRNKTDVDNYLKYLDLVPETFKEYVDYEVVKADKGYGMPDFVIDKVVGQCESFLTDINSDENVHFMISYMNDRIDNLDFLTAEEKESYKALNIQKVRGPLAEGYAYVKDNLPSLKGKATNDMGLAHYVKEDGTKAGKLYYEALFQDAVGYDDTVEEALNYVEKKMGVYYSEIMDCLQYFQSHSAEYNKIMNIQFMGDDINAQIDYYKNSLSGYYPKLNSEVTVNVEYIDESIEDYFSPAAYMTSAIDNNGNEFILLNRGSIYIENYDETTDTTTSVLDHNYLFTTLAHEGFPGHLYQNVYFKNTDAHVIRKVLTNTGMKEGWAQYSERYAYQLYFENHPEYSEYASRYYIANMNFNAAFYTKLDIGIHYLGWTFEETLNYVNQYYEVSRKDVRSMYQQLIEVPTNYPMYFYTYLKLLDLREFALEHGATELEFNTMVLDCGPLPLKYIDAYVREYYENK